MRPRSTAKVILIYHHIAPVKRAADSCDGMDDPALTITPEQLAGQLRGLLRRGYRFVGLPELVATIGRRGWEPWRQVAVTFDDGYADNHTHALPVLRTFNVPATFFVTTDHIHQGVADPQLMNADQLRDLLHCGMTIGAHSRTHPNLLEIPEARAREEIFGSKADLERALGRRIDLFAYPYGAHHRVQVNLVREAGYTAAVSAGGGAQNTRLGLFWLFRYGLSANGNDREDRQAFNPLGGTLRGLYRDVRKKLGWPIRAALKSAFRFQYFSISAFACGPWSVVLWSCSP